MVNAFYPCALRQRQADFFEFQGSLGYLVRHCLKKEKGRLSETIAHFPPSFTNSSPRTGTLSFTVSPRDEGLRVPVCISIWRAWPLHAGLPPTHCGQNTLISVSGAIFHLWTGRAVPRTVFQCWSEVVVHVEALVLLTAMAAIVGCKLHWGGVLLPLGRHPWLPVNRRAFLPEDLLQKTMPGDWKDGSIS